MLKISNRSKNSSIVTFISDLLLLKYTVEILYSVLISIVVCVFFPSTDFCATDSYAAAAAATITTTAESTGACTRSACVRLGIIFCRPTK